jgi:hypothetical protein
VPAAALAPGTVLEVRVRTASPGEGLTVQLAPGVVGRCVCLMWTAALKRPPVSGMMGSADVVEVSIASP